MHPFKNTLPLEKSRSDDLIRVFSCCSKDNEFKKSDFIDMMKEKIESHEKDAPKTLRQTYWCQLTHEEYVSMTEKRHVVVLDITDPL